MKRDQKSAVNDKVCRNSADGECCCKTDNDEHSLSEVMVIIIIVLIVIIQLFNFTCAKSEQFSPISASPICLVPMRILTPALELGELESVEMGLDELAGHLTFPTGVTSNVW